MKKRVLFVIQSIWAGGTNSALCSLYNNIDKSKYDISVLALDYFGGRKVDYEEVIIRKSLISYYYSSGHFDNSIQKIIFCLVKFSKKIVKLFYPNFDELFNKRSIRKIERQYRFDTVVAYNEVNVPFVSHFKCENKVAWVHCDYDKYLPLERTEERYYERYKAIATVSEYTTDVIKRRYPKLSSRCRTIYNLLDTGKILNNSLCQIDDENFKTDLFTIVSVGRIAPVKRFREIPRIAQDLAKRRCEFRWYIIGPEYNAEEANTIRENIKQYDVADKVFWLGGKSNPYPYFKNADLYVCTSESEACPMVFIESKLMGVPIVSSDFPSAKEFIRQGKDGYIIPLEMMAEIINDIISNNGIEFLKTNVSNFSFSNEHLLEQIYEIL